MAVQKSRVSRSKRNKRRTHDSLTKPTLSTDSVTGELHRRHHVTASGYYRGKAVAKLLAKTESSETSEE